MSQATIDQECEEQSIKTKIHSTVSVHPHIYKNLLHHDDDDDDNTAVSDVSLNNDGDKDKELNGAYYPGKSFERKDTSISIVTIGRSIKYSWNILQFSLFRTNERSE